jgi:hypothetical protein
VNELARPFVRLWEWVERVGGFPGQVFFVVAVVMLVIGTLTWINGKR